MPWNRMHCKHYLLVPLGWHPSHLFFCGPAFIGESICVEKVPVWLLLSENFSHLSFCTKARIMLNYRSCQPGWCAFEPEALLLFPKGILPGLQDPNTLTWMRIPWSTGLRAGFRVWIHITCSVTRSCDSSATVHQKIQGCNRNVLKYRMYVLNVKQLSNITYLFSSTK